MRTRAILPEVADVLTEVQQAQQRAAEAETQAADATTMAHGAATGLTSLEQLATDLARAIPAADQVHAQLQDQIDALARAVAAIPAPPAVKVALGDLRLTGSLATGTTRDVVIPIQPPMPTDTYSVGYSLTGGTGILGGLTILGISSKTKTSVTVTIRNTALLSLTLTDAVVSVVAATNT